MIGLILACALVAILALGVVVLPLVRGVRAAPARAEFDRAVYRDQLAEVERDLARGLLKEAEAASARLEIERRLLTTADAPRSTAAAAARHRRLAAAVAVLAVGWSAGLYLVLGAPDVPDQPFAARNADTEMAAAHANVEQAADRLEAKLAAGQGDADSWLLLARTRTALRQWDKASAAYGRALSLAPAEAKPQLEVLFGETTVLAAQGIVTPTAAEAFKAALAAEPKDPVARHYLALADAQAGRDKQAIEAWLKLAAELPMDSDLRAEVARRIAAAAKSAGIDAPPLPPPAPPAK